MKIRLKVYFFTACVGILGLSVFSWAETGETFNASLEGIYWQPIGLDLPVTQPVATTVPGPASDVRNGASRGIEYGFSAGYRLTTTRKNLRVRWLSLQTDKDYNTECPSGNCISAQRGSGGYIQGLALLSASAKSATRLQILDFDFLAPLSTNAFTASFGLRYARIYNNMRVNYLSMPFPQSSVNDQQSKKVNNMIGFRTGIEGNYQISTGVRFIGSTAISLLYGNSHSHETEIDNFNNGATIRSSWTSATYKLMVPEIEMGLKLMYTRVRDFDIWLGYDFLKFIDGLVGQTFVGSSTYSSTQVTRQNVAFMGASLGLRWRFSNPAGV